MSLLSVANDVCRAVGVHEMTSVINNTLNPRTAAEMLSLANEMAQRIAYDTREWTVLRGTGFLDAVNGSARLYNQMSFDLPADFKRFLLTSNIWRTTAPLSPLRFIPDQDEWTHRRLSNWLDYRGEWIKAQDKIFVAPTLFPAWANSKPYAVGDKLYDGVYPTPTTYWQAAVNHTSAATGTFADARAANPALWTTLAAPSGLTLAFGYLVKNCIIISSGPAGSYGDAFMNDGDTFRLDERLLKLGMIWQWKAQKGSPYAEDMGSYEDALRRAAGADSPAPTIIDRLPISQTARVAFPWPSTWP
jgi:hypothetical protein